MTSTATQTSMAQSAKDKLQASASQFWSSIRNFEESMKRPVVTPEGTSNEDEITPEVSLESVMRAMFSSCTTGGVGRDEPRSRVDEADGAPISTQPDQYTNTYQFPRSRSAHEEAVYTQLFTNQQIRAEEAVCHLREQLEHRKEERSSQKPTPTQISTAFKTIPGPFPVSSPTKKREISIPNKAQDISSSPARSTAKAIPENGATMSFDDSISAISQQTLEEMARMYETDETLLNRVFSDVTQDPADAAMESWRHTQAKNSSAKRNGSRMFPLKLTRSGPSHGTINTKNSRGTMRSIGTKSTLSTQTTDFANAWRRDEQKYWEDVVNEQDEPVVADQMFMKVREMRRESGDNKSKRDGTITTAGSSMYSSSPGTPGRQSPSHIVVNSRRMVSSRPEDSGALMDVLVVPPGTEIGEI